MLKTHEKNPKTNVTSFATYVFVSKLNNASMSNTTDRYESSNVFTSRSTRTSHLMHSWVVRPVPLTRETKRFSPHTTEPWWWCVDLYESYDLSTMNIHYAAVLSIHECLSFLCTKTSVFLVLKEPREERKQQECSSFQKHHVKCTINKVFLVRKGPREVHKNTKYSSF